jgi:hypothetical protein
MLMDRIDHKDLPPDGTRYEKIVSILEAYYEQTLFLAAAAVYNRTGSLDHAAATLAASGFAPPPRLQHHRDDKDEEGLRRWLDENQEEIIEGPWADTKLAMILSRGDLPWIY